MKTLLRNTVIYTTILFILPQIIPGVRIGGGIGTLLIGGLALALLHLIVKPILNIISLPVNIISLGLFSLFINTFILYLLTIFVSDIKISQFVYQKISGYGFVIPQLSFNTFFAYLYTAFLLSLLDKLINWLRK